MNYLKTHNRSSSGTLKLFFAALVVIAVVLGGLQFFAPHIVPGIFHALVRPFWRLEFAIDSGLLSSTELLLKENEILKRELESAAVRLDTIRAIEEENKELKTLFGRVVMSTSTATSTETGDGLPVSTDGPRILAAVLARPPSLAYDEIIIDVGRDFDVREGARIYASSDVLIGKVKSVLGKSSKAVLLSSPGERYEVLIGKGNISATAVGRGGGQYEAELPSGTNIAEGDFAIAPSVSDKPFARVIKIVSDPAQAFEVVLLAPPSNIYQLRWVLVERM